MKTALIALDWGTTSFRAFRLGPTGEVIETKADRAGILQVPRGEFEEVFTRLVQPWLAENPRLPVIASGMITSKQGWVETGYVSCPAGLAQLAGRLVMRRTNTGHAIHFVPWITHPSRVGFCTECSAPGASFSWTNSLAGAWSPTCRACSSARR